MGKRIILIAFVVVCFIILFSCAEEKPLDLNLQDLVETIGKEIDLSNTIEYEDTIQNELGITEEIAVQLVVLKEIDVLSAKILFLVEAVDKDAAKDIENKLKVYKNNKLNELRDYTLNADNERQYYMVDDSEIMVEQQYVFFAVNEQSKEINDMIKEYIKNNK